MGLFGDSRSRLSRLERPPCGHRDGPPARGATHILAALSPCLLCRCHWLLCGALWPLAVGAKNFFGPDVSVIGAMAFWAACAMLLGLPYALLWTDNARQLLWRAPFALLLGVIPPLGLIGFASPLTATGFLFPACSWAGLALSLIGCGLIVAYPGVGFPSLTTIALLANALYAGDRKPPSDWQAIDTHFGAVSHGQASPLREYLAAQAIQDQARASSARIIVFPESVVPRWTESTELFWKPAIEALERGGKIVLIGALIPESLPFQSNDLRAAVDLLRAAHESATHDPQRTSPQAAEPYCYRNAVIVRGTESGTFLQRVPVPVSMWKPFSRGRSAIESVWQSDSRDCRRAGWRIDLLRTGHCLDGVDRRALPPHPHCRFFQ